MTLNRSVTVNEDNVRKWSVKNYLKNNWKNFKELTIEESYVETNSNLIKILTNGDKFGEKLEKVTLKNLDFETEDYFDHLDSALTRFVCGDLLPRLKEIHVIDVDITDYLLLQLIVGRWKIT